MKHGSGRHAVELHQRMRAVVAGAHRDAFQIQQRGQIMRVRALDQKRDHRRLVRGFADDAQARNLLEPRRGVGQQLLLARGDALHADALEIAHRHAQPGEPGDVGRAGLEASGWVSEGRTLDAHLADHLATAEEWHHIGQDLAPRPQPTGAGRPAHLVPGEGIEIAAQRAHVHGHVRHRLRAIDQQRNAALAAGGGDLGQRIDRAQHVGYMRHRGQSHIGGEHGDELIHAQFAARVDGRRLSVAPARWPTSCHGTILAWCSMRVTSTLSPGLSRGSR